MNGSVPVVRTRSTTVKKNHIPKICNAGCATNQVAPKNVPAVREAISLRSSILTSARSAHKSCAGRKIPSKKLAIEEEQIFSIRIHVRKQILSHLKTMDAPQDTISI